MQACQAAFQGTKASAVEPSVGLARDRAATWKFRVNAGSLNTKLAPIARLWKCHVPDVILKIEVLVFDPIRIIQFQRRMQQLAAKDR